MVERREGGKEGIRLKTKETLTYLNTMAYCFSL